MSEIILNKQFGANILREVPVAQSTILGIGYACLDNSPDADNPFVRNQYNFDQGFYRGLFDFASPLTGARMNGTPETYGRHRVVAALLDRIGEPRATVLDLGCGTLDIARMIPADKFGRLQMINSDISGPWSSGDNFSSLERGTKSLLATGFTSQDSIYNLQYDFNNSDWVFGVKTLDFIVSNMVLHHIHHDLKPVLLKAMYASLEDGGSIIFSDVFDKDEKGARLTQAGLRGPEECGGYMTTVSEFISMARQIGFGIDSNAGVLAEHGRNHQTGEELRHGIADLHATMAINKAIWFMELKK